MTSAITLPAPPMPPPPAFVLPPGAHAWWWPAPSLGWGNPSEQIAAAVALGLRGVIPQAGLAAPAFCAKHYRAARAAGLFVTCGIGMDGSDDTEDQIVNAIVAGLAAADAVMLDWESPRAWETDAGRARMQRIVSRALSIPGVLGRVTDCPWWAPMFYESHDAEGNVVKHATHPHAPTSIVGQLCTNDRYVQAYGNAKTPDRAAVRAADGRSLDMLAWARDPSQYASLGGWVVRGSFESYRRSVTDHVRTLLAEPTQCLWDLREADASCVVGLEAAAALRRLGYAAPDDVAVFQRAAALSPDGRVGPQTCLALGVLWAPGAVA